MAEFLHLPVTDLPVSPPQASFLRSPRESEPFVLNGRKMDGRKIDGRKMNTLEIGKPNSCMPGTSLRSRPRNKILFIHFSAIHFSAINVFTALIQDSARPPYS